MTGPTISSARLQRAVIRLLLAFSCLLLTCVQVFASEDPVLVTVLQGKNGAIKKDSLRETVDVIYYSPLVSNIANPANDKYINTVTLYVDEDYRVPAQSSFQANLWVTIIYTDLSGNQDSISRKEFMVKYDTAIGARHMSRNSFRFDNCRKVKMRIDSVSINGAAWDVTQMLVLENRMSVRRDYAFNCDVIKVSAVTHLEGDTSSSGNIDELKVKWTLDPGAGITHYDVEWTWVDVEALDYYKTEGVFDPDKLFIKNATRVTIISALDEYRVPLIYDGNGYLFYRVRPVQQKENGDIVPGIWSTDDNNITWYHYVKGHEPGLNWQVSTSYAEDGKRKTVIQYFDGTLRGRQTVTKSIDRHYLVGIDSVYTTVAESLYDYQGRPTINILPAPTLNRVIEYAHNFNKFTTDVYPKTLYDLVPLEGEKCATYTPDLDSSSGASKYYSSNNPLIAAYVATSHNYIPSAFGYPYTETQYTADPTGRVAAQGGVGQEYQLNKGHETKYFYGSADQEELDALFGTEVGDASHYFKNMVRDGNGQYSVSYVDMRGRTIATALAGPVPDSLDALNSFKTRTYTRNLLANGNNVVKDRSIESSTTLLVTKKGLHTFHYELNPQSAEIVACKPPGEPVCYDCYYDLEIRITSDCMDEPIVITRKNFTFGSYDVECGNAPPTLVVDEEYELDEGEYNITKILTLSKDAQDWYRKNLFAVNNICKTLEDFYTENYNVLLAAANCNVTCESCITELGSPSDFRTRYLESQGLNPANPVAFEMEITAAYNEALAACQALCGAANGTNKLLFLKEMMLQDMMPDEGQYGRLNGSADYGDGNPQYEESSTNPYNIFNQAVPYEGYKNPWRQLSNASALLPFYRNPWNPATGVNYYADEQGQPVVIPDNAESFTQIFREEWAQSLLYLHPEYDKLRYAETNLGTSYDWDVTVENTDTWQAADAAGFISTNILNLDPFFSGLGAAETTRNPDYYGLTYRNMMNTFLTSSYRKTGKTIWQLAWMSVNCKEDDGNCTINAIPPFDIKEGCSGDKDMVWRLFRSMYLSEKERMLSELIQFRNLDTKRDNILNNPAFHYQRRFVMPDDVSNNGFFTQYNFALNANGVSQATNMADQEMALEFKETCESYISMWTSKLETCPELAAHPEKKEILRKIMDGLVNVCIRGSDADHPTGSSTANPNELSFPSSFEEVIRSVFDDYEIDESVVCTPYVIDYPKPYDRQMPLSNPMVVEQQDSCLCARLDVLEAEKNQLGFSGTLSEFIAAQHGTLIRQSFLDTLLSGCANGIDACKLYDPPLEIPAILDCNTPLNNCIDCRQYKAAKLQFNTLYPTHAVIYEGDELTDEQLASNKLFEQFMNARTGLSRGWDDYLQFEKDCAAYNDDWNCDELQDVRDAFVLSYGDSTWGGACESAFVTYFNTHFGTTLTFAQIQSLFQQYCGSLPNVCQPTINCAGFENVIDSFYRRYGMPIAINAQCDSLFADHFNGIYGTDYSYPELVQLYQTTCGGQLDVCRQFDCSRLQDIIDGWTSCRPNVIFAGECDSLWVDYFNNLYGLELEGWQIDSIYRSCGIVLNPCGTTLSCTSLQQMLISYKNMGTAACAGSGLDSLSSTFCNDCFVWYVNDRLGTTYVYSEIAALYQKACGRPLTLCQPVDSCGILTKFVQDFNTWLLVNPGVGPCDSLFTVQFNAHFGLSYDYGQIMLLYKRTCGKTVELCNTLPAITCQQLQDIYNKFRGMYPDPSRYFADSCQQAFTYFFNANTGDTLSFPEIQMYYYQLCGMELNICQPDSCGRLGEVIVQYNAAFGSDALPRPLSRDVFVELYNELFKPLRRVTWGEVARIYGACGVPLPLFPENTTYLMDCNRLSPAIRAFYMLNKGMPPDQCGQLFTRFINQYYSMAFTDYGQIRQWALDNCDVELNVCGVEKNALTVHLRPAAAPATSVLPPRLCNTNAVIPSIVEDEGDPCDYLTDMALHLATEQYNKYVQLQYENFDSTYRAKCLSAGALEQFTVTADVAEYHFTLYYYDQAGNLVKTVPPEGVSVSKMDDTEYDNWIALVKSQRALDASEPADNKLLTEYRYNSLNQVVEQISPDGGTSHFWYDRLGRLVLSRNARQAGNDEYSYTLYDALGRITEVGQLTSVTEPDDDITRDPENLLGWLTAAAASREQITTTYYDLPAEELEEGTERLLYQANLRNRVSYTRLKDAIGDDPTSTTYYSYDIHGNVDTLLQSYGKGVLNEVSGHMTKRIEYNYDLISGKVNEVAYQPGVTDQFYHRYVYDAENRLTQVYTSADREHWEKQAGYSYYRHGPLARTELGQLKVQGIDYAYTLQGWLKGVNSNAIGSSFDMGGDGTGTSRPARDAYSYSLQYNAGDYKAVSTNKYPFVKVDLLAPVTDDRPVGRGLYNGNISSMLVNIPKLGDAQLYGYSYDQLNRLTAMNAYTGLNSGNNSFVPVGSTNYKERVSYDGNGNILSYLRNRAGVGVDTSMDKLSYTYEYDGDGFLVKNRLKQVSDAVVSTPAGTGDLPTGQVSDNYGYDAIGNLVKDESEGIASGGIEWNVYGKISQITKTNGGGTTVIKYTYDATGNRIGKWVQVGAGTPKQTAYVRDASGNVMAIYEKGNSEVNGGLLSQIEVPLYGSSRLGVWRPDREVETTGWELFDTDPMTGTGGGIAGGWERGRVQFELSNHLGNVLVTISDVRIPVLMPEGIELCDDPVHPACYRPIDYYLPQVLTANDYYPFGMGMPGRKYSEGNYRYGFNGKENDNDVKGEGNQQDYGMRIYDPRLGRFLSVDPIANLYPELTPYQFSSNRPIDGIDLDGLEYHPATYDYKSALYIANLTRKDKLTTQQIEEQGNAMNKAHRQGLTLGLFLSADIYTGGRISSALVLQHFAGMGEHNRAKTPEGRAIQDQRIKESFVNGIIGWGSVRIFYQAFSFLRGVYTESTKYLFRGTSEGYAGSRASQLLEVTPVSSDPGISTLFGIYSKNFNNGVVHIAIPQDLVGVSQGAGNVLQNIEKEIALNVAPIEFAKRASYTISADKAREILAGLGVKIPAKINTLDDLNKLVKEMPKMSETQVDEFVKEAIKSIPKK